jgi:hypothetical protein
MKSLVWIGAVTLLGCGGGSENTPPPSDGHEVQDPYAEGGGEQGAPAGEQGGEAPAETAGAPASVMVKAVIEGTEVGARVQVLDGDRVVAEGEAPLSAQVTSGTYTFTAQVTDAAVLVDRPTVRNENVEVAPGGPHDVTISIPRAQVRLKVVRAGRLLRFQEIVLMHQGSTEPVYTFRQGNDHVPISPGRYEADVKLGRNQVIHVQGITFMEGATQDIPIEINN